LRIALPKPSSNPCKTSTPLASCAGMRSFDVLKVKYRLHCDFTETVRQRFNYELRNPKKRVVNSHCDHMLVYIYTLGKRQRFVELDRPACNVLISLPEPSYVILPEIHACEQDNGTSAHCHNADSVNNSSVTVWALFPRREGGRGGLRTVHRLVKESGHRQQKRIRRVRRHTMIRVRTRGMNPGRVGHHSTYGSVVPESST